MALGTPVSTNANAATAINTAMAGTLPATISNGSLALAFVTNNSASTLSGVTSGWTLIAGPTTIATFNNQCIWLYAKAVGVADESAAFAGTLSTSGRWTVSITVIPGAASSLDVAAAYSAGSSETITSLAFGAVTPVTANDMLMIFGSRYIPAASTATSTPPSGYTELVDAATTNTSGAKFGNWVGYKQLSGQAGSAQGAPTVTLDAAGNMNGWIVAIAPGATNVPPTANAGPDQTAVEPYTTVTLTSAASASNDSGTLTRSWAHTSGPSSTGALSSTTATSPTVPSSPGLTDQTDVWTVTITDSVGTSNTATDSVSITTLAATEGYLNGSGVWKPMQVVAL